MRRRVDFYPFLPSRSRLRHYRVGRAAALLRWTCRDGRAVQHGRGAVPGGGHSPAHLTAMCPVPGSTSYLENSIWRRGVFEPAHRLRHSIMMARETLIRQGTFDQRCRGSRNACRSADLRSAIKREALGTAADDWANVWRRAPTSTRCFDRRYTPDWQAADLGGGSAKTVKLHVGPWYDMFAYDTIKMFAGPRNGAMTRRRGAGQRRPMGPWAHWCPNRRPAAADRHRFVPRRVSSWTRSSCDSSTIIEGLDNG